MAGVLTDGSASDGNRTESGLVAGSTMMVGNPDDSRVTSELALFALFADVERAVSVFISRIATDVADCPSVSFIRWL